MVSFPLSGVKIALAALAVVIIRIAGIAKMAQTKTATVADNHIVFRDSLGLDILNAPWKIAGSPPPDAFPLRCRRRFRAAEFPRPLPMFPRSCPPGDLLVDRRAGVE